MDHDKGPRKKTTEWPVPLTTHVRIKELTEFCSEVLIIQSKDQKNLKKYLSKIDRGNTNFHAVMPGCLNVVISPQLTSCDHKTLKLSYL